MDRNFDTVQIVVVIVNVALRKESVDRNIGPLMFRVQPRVALRKESVDRNFINVARAADRVRRSPQGERG